MVMVVVVCFVILTCCSCKSYFCYCSCQCCRCCCCRLFWTADTFILLHEPGKWKQMAAKQLEDHLRITEADLRQQAKRWMDTYNFNVIENLVAPPKCVVCGEPAAKRCSKCHQEWWELRLLLFVANIPLTKADSISGQCDYRQDQLYNYTEHDALHLTTNQPWSSFINENPFTLQVLPSRVPSKPLEQTQNRLRLAQRATRKRLIRERRAKPET